MVKAVSTSDLIGVVGSGAMGAGIAQIASAAGYRVKLFDVRPEAADKALNNIRQMFGKLAEKGKMSAQEADSAGGRLAVAHNLSELSAASLVVEAIVEDLQAKRNLFGELEAIVSDDCILASNTSSISITAIAAKLRRPQRLAGMHFFNPVPLMALVEVVSGLATDQEVARTVYETAIRWGKSPVHTASTPGFIVNRVARPYYAEALRIATERAGTPATLDAIYREAGGFRMGPFELMDLIGHDVNFAVTSSVFAAYFNDPRFTPSIMQQELVNAGFLGRKSGRGFYRYGEEITQEQPSSEVASGGPGHVKLVGSTPIAKAIAARLVENNVRLEKEDGTGDEFCMTCGEAKIFLTDGRTATQRAKDSGYPNTVLVDLALDFATCKRVALVPADQCTPEAYQDAVRLLQAAGYAVSRLGDVPGMAVMRTVAMLANEAADTVNQGVCNVLAVDMAMQKGVNYPRGPLAWADSIGLSTVITVLRNLALTYGEDRYRISPLIQRKVASGAMFHD